MTNVTTYVAVLLSTCITLASCAQTGPAAPGAIEQESTPPEALLPDSIDGRIIAGYLDGRNDDLLTGGLGLGGLRDKAPELVANSSIPARALRRNRIHHNYNALVDTSVGGGFGTIYGPVGRQNMMIGGWEYLTGIGLDNGVEATIAVQVPDSFDPQNACLLAAPSSGSRGVYGAIGTTGEWALNRGCAVVFSDKGTGTGFYFFDNGQSYNLQGQLEEFPPRNPFYTDRSTPTADAPEIPYLIATRHAHSGHNPEKDWGRLVLDSIQAAFYLLNKHHRQGNEWYTRENTLVIAASISNGGNSVIRAAEQDEERWIDGVVASEPSVTVPAKPATEIYQANRKMTEHSRSMLDTATWLALYQPCALLAESNRSMPMVTQARATLGPLMQARCGLLHRDGLLNAATLSAQADEALKKIEDRGILPETRLVGGFSIFAQLWEALATTYSNAYGRFSARDLTCSTGFAYVNNKQQPVLMSEPERQQLPAVSGGIVPVAGVKLVDFDAGNGPVELYHSLDEKGVADLGYGNMKCFRELFERNPAVKQGINEIAVSGNLHAKPTIIVHGRSDHLINVNHSSRPYTALNHEVEGKDSNLHYYEVTNAQHFDALIKYPVYGDRLVPLHPYLEASLNLMYAHLTDGEPLPPSQSIYTRPRQSAAHAFTRQNLPLIEQDPGRNLINFDQGKMMIP